MGCNLKDIAPAEQTSLKDLAGKRVGIDAFLTAFQFLTTMRDRSPQGDGMPLRVFDINKPGDLMNIAMGGDVGTLVDNNQTRANR